MNKEEPAEGGDSKETTEEILKEHAKDDENQDEPSDSEEESNFPATHIKIQHFGGTRYSHNISLYIVYIFVF